MGKDKIAKNNRINLESSGFSKLYKTQIYLTKLDSKRKTDKEFIDIFSQVCIVNNNKLFSISWKDEDLELEGIYHDVSYLSFHKYWLDGIFYENDKRRGFRNLIECTKISEINLDNFSLFYEFKKNVNVKIIDSIDTLLDEITNIEYYVYNTRAILFESEEKKILIGLESDFVMVISDNPKYIDELVNELEE